MFYELNEPVVFSTVHQRIFNHIDSALTQDTGIPIGRSLFFGLNGNLRHQLSEALYYETRAWRPAGPAKR